MQIGDIVTHTTKGWYVKVREISGAEIRVKHICSKKGNPSCPSSMTAYENSRLYPKAELIVSRLPKSFQVLMEAEKKKAEHNKPRYFPDIFKIGDEVGIIRHAHGWEDGRISGTIVSWAYGCMVEDEYGSQWEIEHPRDIYHI